MKNWFKTSAFLCLTLLVILVGCEKSGPLAGHNLPDTIRVYPGYNVPPIVITNEVQIGNVLSYFAGSQKRWRHYWDTIPATGITVGFEKNGKQIATAFICSNWAIVKANDNYSTDLTQQEHDNLFQILGVKN